MEVDEGPVGINGEMFVSTAVLELGTRMFSEMSC